MKSQLTVGFAQPRAAARRENRQVRENEGYILKTKPWGSDLQGSARIGESKTVAGVCSEEIGV